MERATVAGDGFRPKSALSCGVATAERPPPWLSLPHPPWLFPAPLLPRPPVQLGKHQTVESPTPPPPSHAVPPPTMVVPPAVPAATSPRVISAADPGLDVSNRDLGNRDSSGVHILPVVEGLLHVS